MRGYEGSESDYIPERKIPCVYFGTSKKCTGNAHMFVIGSLGMALKACDKCEEYEEEEKMKKEEIMAKGQKTMKRKQKGRGKEA